MSDGLRVRVGSGWLEVAAFEWYDLLVWDGVCTNGLASSSIALKVFGLSGGV